MNVVVSTSKVLLSWCTAARTGKSREQLYALLFNKLPGAAKRIPMKKAYRGPGLTAVQAWWEQWKEWMLYFKDQSAPLVLDFQGLLQAFRGKEEDARAEVEAFMEHVQRKWQTKEGSLLIVSLSPRFSGLLFVTSLLRSFSVLRPIVYGSEMIWLVSLFLDLRPPKNLD